MFEKMVTVSLKKKSHGKATPSAVFFPFYRTLHSARVLLAGVDGERCNQQPGLRCVPESDRFAN